MANHLRDDNARKRNALKIAPVKLYIPCNTLDDKEKLEQTKYLYLRKRCEPKLL